MIHIETEPSRQLIKISYSQSVQHHEVSACHERIRANLAGYEPGFVLLVDLSAVESIDLSCAPDIEQIMDLMNEKGIGSVIRVIPDQHKDIGFNIMSLFHYDKGVRMMTCESLDQAIELLGS